MPPNPTCGGLPGAPLTVGPGRSLLEAVQFKAAVGGPHAVIAWHRKRFSAKCPVGRLQHHHAAEEDCKHLPSVVQDVLQDSHRQAAGRVAYFQALAQGKSGSGRENASP
uniref:Uncharacterized protein n=1 Tax=Pyrodinium bahamense TaxID=73915 RepID=A0A7S0B9W4_9DINO